MFEASVDRFGRTVAGVWMIEVGQDVPGSVFERSSQCDELGQTPQYAGGGQRVDFGFHQSLARARIGRAVGINDVLVDAPGDFEGDVAIAGEQVKDPMLLARGEQAGSGVQASCGPCTGDRWPARADGGVLAGCACDTHGEHHRQGVRRGRGP